MILLIGILAYVRWLLLETIIDGAAGKGSACAASLTVCARSCSGLFVGPEGRLSLEPLATSVGCSCFLTEIAWVSPVPARTRVA